MTDAPEPGQSIAHVAVPDLRDLGGWPTRDGGRVRAGGPGGYAGTVPVAIILASSLACISAVLSGS